MKHVVFAHRKLSFGGGERVLVEQIAALADLPVRITVLFRKEPAHRDLEPELRARNPKVEAVLHLPGAWACGRFLRSARPDALVLCNHKGVQRALPWLARLGRRIPTLVTLHEHYERHLRKYRSIRRLVDKWIITWAFGEAVRAHLGPQPCVVIHPLYPRPAVEALSHEEIQAARRQLGLPLDEKVIGYVGQIDERKDPETLLAFAEALSTQFQNPLHVVLAGRESPSISDRLNAAAARTKANIVLHRLGPMQSLDPAFAALDLYVMTSRNEGFFPLALIEALERGVPVLAPTVGGIGTVAKDGEGAFLFSKPDDRQSIPQVTLEAVAAKLAPLLEDPGAWQAQRAKAHALGVGLTAGYDAAARFREAMRPWL